MFSSTPASARVLTLTPALGVFLPFNRTWPPKYQAETLDYTIDLSRFLAATDIVTAAATTISGSDSALNCSSCTHTGSTVTFRLTSGTAGLTSLIVTTITLQSGQTLQCDLPIAVLSPPI
jgi:hypothetical protein